MGTLLRPMHAVAKAKAAPWACLGQCVQQPRPRVRACSQGQDSLNGHATKARACNQGLGSLHGHAAKAKAAFIGTQFRLEAPNEHVAKPGAHNRGQGRPHKWASSEGQGRSLPWAYGFGQALGG